MCISVDFVGVQYNLYPRSPKWLLVICDGFRLRRRRHRIERSDEEQCQSQLVDVLNIYTENAWWKAHEKQEMAADVYRAKQRKKEKKARGLLCRSQRSKGTSGIMLIE